MLAASIHTKHGQMQNNDKMTVNDYTAMDSTQQSGGSQQELPDVKCEVPDLLLDVVDLK